MKPAQFALPLLVCIVTLTGCGKGVPSAVSGKVLLDGQPLAGASVQLIASGNDVLGMYSQTTDSAGNFRISEKGSSNNPIKPGSYVVLVSKTEMPAMGQVNELVPVIYMDRTKSPLKVEITNANTQLPPLELKSDAK